MAMSLISFLTLYQTTIRTGKTKHAPCPMIAMLVPACMIPIVAAAVTAMKTRLTATLGQNVGYLDRAILFSFSNRSSNSGNEIYYSHAMQTEKKTKEKKKKLVASAVVYYQCRDRASERNDCLSILDIDHAGMRQAPLRFPLDCFLVQAPKCDLCNERPFTSSSTGKSCIVGMLQ